MHYMLESNVMCNLKGLKNSDHFVGAKPDVKMEILQQAIPSSGAELSAELSPSELPDDAALFTFFLAAFFFSVPFPGLTFFLALVPPTVH